MKVRTALISLAGLAVVGAIAAGILSGFSGEKPPEQVTKERPVDAKTVLVQRQTIPVFYEATGTVRARLNATLASKVIGHVVAVDVKEGDAVLAGRQLVSLDARELGAAVQVASASYDAARAASSNALMNSRMESGTSEARVAGAEYQVAQARAALAGAQSKLDLALAGPRPQERMQAHLTTEQARASMGLAQSDLERAKSLEAVGAIPRRQLDVAQSAFAVAKAQYESAQEAERIAQDGTRNEDIQAAREAVAQATAGVKAAEAGLRQAKAGALSVQVRQGEVRSAEAQAKLSAASLVSAQVALAYSRISAPFDGVVTRRFVDPGSFASGGTPLIALEGGGYRLEVSVPEDVLPHVSSGESLPVMLDALNREMAAKVVEIVPQGDATSHTFLVRLQLEGTPGVRSGMFGRSKIVLSAKQGILVPTSALGERQGLRYVFVVGDDHIARLRIVTVGDSNGDETEVLSGLDDGERIVTDLLDQVRDGARIAR